MAIEVKNLRYVYLPKTPNYVVALDDVSLTIPEHSFAAFIGRTGSGKSTLVQTFNALLLPTSGEVVVDEFTVGPNKRKNKNIKIACICLRQNSRKNITLIVIFRAGSDYTYSFTH